MSDANGVEGSKTVGFLDLSRELRDQIYRDLLSRPIGYGAERRRQRFETTILRANKQIHREASKVLYEENAWVVFEMRVRSELRDLTSDPNLITMSRDFWRSGRLPFGGNPSLRVYLEEPRRRDCEIVDYIIMPLEWVGDMTQAFVHSHFSSKLELVVHFHKDRKHEGRQRMAMEFLEMIRGVKKVNITGLSPPSLGYQLAEHMMTSIKSTDELIDQTSEYIRRAELVLAQGQVYRAEELYEQGSCSLVGYAGSKAFSPLSRDTRTQSRVFSSKICECLEGMAVCSFRHGDSLSACTELRDYILTTGDLPDSQKARGFYYHGLASVAAGLDLEALFSFMQALTLVPGYEAVDKEVDALEERVSQGVGGYEAKVLILKNGNLELLRPLRHKNAGDAKLSEQQRVALALQFKHWERSLRAFLGIKVAPVLF